MRIKQWYLALFLLSIPLDALSATPSVEDNSRVNATICARVLNVGHFIVKLGAEPNLYPFFVEVKCTKKLNGNSDSLLDPDHISTFRIHGPSQTFSYPEEKLIGRIFKLSLIKNPEGWLLVHGSEDPNQCGE